MNIKQILFLITLIGGMHIATASQEEQEEKNTILTMKTKIAAIPLKRLLFHSPKIYENELYLKKGPAECTYIADKTADGSIKFVPGVDKKHPGEEVKDLYHYLHYNHINYYRTDKPFAKELAQHVTEETAIYCPNLIDGYYNGKPIRVGGILRNSGNPCEDCPKLKKFIEQHKAKQSQQ